MKFNNILKAYLMALAFITIDVHAQSNPELMISNFSLNKGETAELPIILKNPNLDVAGMQFNMVLTEGLSLVKKGRGFDYTRGESMMEEDDYNYDISYKEGEGYLFVIYPKDVKYIFTGKEGVLVTVKVQASEDYELGSILLKNIAITNTNEQEYNQPDYKYDITTGISETMMDKTLESNVYSLSGVKVGENSLSIEGLHKGIYIVNGKKVIK